MFAIYQLMADILLHCLKRNMTHKRNRCEVATTIIVGCINPDIAEAPTPTFRETIFNKMGPCMQARKPKNGWKLRQTPKAPRNPTGNSDINISLVWPTPHFLAAVV